MGNRRRRRASKSDQIFNLVHALVKAASSSSAVVGPYEIIGEDRQLVLEELGITEQAVEEILLHLPKVLKRCNDHDLDVVPITLRGYKLRKKVLDNQPPPLQGIRFCVVRNGPSRTYALAFNLPPDHWLKAAHYDRVTQMIAGGTDRFKETLKQGHLKSSAQKDSLARAAKPLVRRMQDLKDEEDLQPPLLTD
jgi:hypothetical protein